ncbi:MAG TPA: SBBP repeat-containing protein [Bryobacteraceae bacterium]|nr:SBBP repeat-containing protein [Bryobacteraceae bacterium]
MYSTYLGGSLDDAATAVAVDSAGNAYVGGNTVSTNFPVLNAFQSHSNGAANANSQPVIATGDGFVAKFDTTGKLQYSSYLGGSGDDGVMGIAVDGAGAAYLTGFTSSADFPVTSNALQRTFKGPSSVTGERGFVWGDAFVAKVTANGALSYATFLGGSQDDAGMAIAVDGSGSAIVGGLANSTDLAVTSNAQQGAFGGNGPSGFTDPTGDGFIAKLSADGSTLQYLSYFGGSSSDAISGIALDGQGNVIVAGATTSTNLKTTSNAAQKAFGGQSSDTPTETMGDAFMAVFSGIATIVSATPAITSVSNAASFASALAPGSSAAVFGTNLPASASAGATVGGQAAQVVSATASEWVIVIPSSAAAGSTSVQVGTSAPFAITLSAYAPALYSSNGSGTGAAMVSPSAASYLPGATITIFATGLGAAGANGQPAQLPAVTVGSTQVSVFSVTPSASSPGTYQIVIQIPPSTPSGNSAIALSIGGVTSPSLTLPVGAISGVTIEFVENGASYLPGFSQGSWVTITGNNLSGTTRIWTGADFNGNSLPTSLDHVSVTIDGKPAYVYFVSGTQINVLAPADAAQGQVPVQVTYNGTQSNIVMATESSFSPALFTFTPAGGRYAAAVRIDGQYIGPATLYAGLTAPANAGDTLELYGTGFGPTTPTTDFSQIFSGAPPTANTVTATIGGVAASVQFAGLVAPGEYQFNVIVPSVPSGDNLVVLKVNGITTQANTYLTVH